MREVAVLTTVFTHVYADKYVKSNARDIISREHPLSEDIINILKTQKGYVDSKYIQDKLDKHNAHVNMTLKKMRDKGKVDFQYVKSKRSDRTLIVYKLLTPKSLKPELPEPETPEPAETIKTK